MPNGGQAAGWVIGANGEVELIGASSNPVKTNPFACGLSLEKIRSTK